MNTSHFKRLWLLSALVVILSSGCVPAQSVVTPTPNKPLQTLEAVQGSPTPSVLETKILLSFFSNHLSMTVANTKMTFDEFLSIFSYQQKYFDVNGDGNVEIILTGTSVIPEKSFFVIYSIEPNEQIKEIYFLSAVSVYSTDVQYEISAPNIFVDFLTQWGGTGTLSTSIERNIVRCETKCDSISFTYYYENFAGDPASPIDISDFRFKNSIYTISDDQIEIQTAGYSLETITTNENMCDPSGKQSQLKVSTDKHILTPKVYRKYIWDNGNFNELEYQETPGFEIIGYDKGGYSNNIFYLIEYSEGTNTVSLAEKLKAYYDFFGISQAEGNKLSVLPCNKIDEHAERVPKSIPTAHYYDESNNQDFFAAVNNQCKLAVWKAKLGDHSALLSEIIFLGHETLTNCDSNFISFQWTNLTGSDVPELAIISGLANQNLWVFQVDSGIKSLYQSSGFAHGVNLVGVQLIKRKEKRVDLVIGLPYHTEGCLDRFECFSLGKGYDIYTWDDAVKSFVLSK
ncbi:MAG: hypothetical protein HZB50_05785 [Chloroflexi bacterium]|nr:hypothetical protein [Chloroflexota bacterium]